jgi:hypothetical protein
VRLWISFDLLEVVKPAFDANGSFIPYPQTDVPLHRMGEA